MIPFRLFYVVYLTNLFFTIPCYMLFYIVKSLYNFDSIIFSIIWNTSMIMCVIVCYRLILKETLFGKYERIIVKTKFKNILGDLFVIHSL